MSSDPPKVFLSYSHDSAAHQERVLALADRLRADGVDAYLDRYEPAPERGWPRWMEDRIEEADFVLVICTEVYARRFRGREEPGRGLGVAWEGAIFTQELYEAGVRTTSFLPVVFTDADRDHIPTVLRPFTWYHVGTEAGYEELYRRLTDQPEVSMPPLGARRRLPSRRPRSSFAPPAEPPPPSPDPETPPAAAAPETALPPAPRRAPASPFVVGPAITRDADFFGREAEKARLGDALARGAAVQILGERRMGKTSRRRSFWSTRRKPSPTPPTGSTAASSTPSGPAARTAISCGCRRRATTSTRASAPAG